MLRFLDDFKGYGQAMNMTAGAYASLAGPATGQAGPDNFSFVTDPSGDTSETVLRIQTPPGTIFPMARRVLPTPAKTIGASVRFWVPALSTEGVRYPLAFLRDGNEAAYALSIDSLGRLQVRASFGSTPLYTSTGPVVTAQGWWHVEMKVVADTVDGSIEVRCEGQPVQGLDISGIDTGSADFLQAGFGNRSAPTSVGTPLFLKDFTVWDGVEGQVDDFVGTAFVHRHTLTSDVANDWNVVDGSSGFEILNRVPSPSSAYLGAVDDPLPPAYAATISPLPEDITAVRGVQVRYMAAKNDGGDALFQAGLVASPDDAPEEWETPESSLTVAQTYWYGVNEHNPKTGFRWLPGELNAANVTLKRNA